VKDGMGSNGTYTKQLLRFMLSHHIQPPLPTPPLGAIAPGTWRPAPPPLVAVMRLRRTKAPRQPGSRQALAIMNPFHSWKIWVGQPAQSMG